MFHRSWPLFREMDKIKSKQEVKQCLKCLCSLLNALFNCTVTPELLRKAKFDDLSEAEFNEMRNLLSAVMGAIQLSSEQFEYLFRQNNSQKLNTGRKLLIVFGYFIGARNCLKQIVTKRIKCLSLISNCELLLSEISKQIANSSKNGSTSDVSGDSLYFYWAVKSQLRLVNNDLQCFMAKCVDTEQPQNEVPVSLLLNHFQNFKQAVNIGGNPTETVKLVEYFVTWQNQVPCFNMWIRSVIEIEKSSNEVMATNLFTIVQPKTMLRNYLQYLIKRIEELQNLLADPQVSFAVPGSCSLLHDSSSDGGECRDRFVGESIKYYERQNRRKMQKLLSRLDRKIILVDDQRK